MTMFRQTIREALILLVASSFLGFLYTGFTGRGFFGTAKTREAAHSIPNSGSMMISLDEAKHLYDAGALFLDSRHAFDFRLGHIRGALSMPLPEFDAHLGQLVSVPKEKSLVAYCDGADCNSSIELAGRLYDTGYTNVKIFFGGWQEWKGQNLPMEFSAQ
jgi:rhodanese-related sulfurtransferase